MGERRTPDRAAGTAVPAVGGAVSRRAAAFAVWYLRAVAAVNFLGAVRVWLGQDVRRHNSRWFQIESLYRANAKYRPAWEPRFLLFEKSADLPRIALASARAEGFLEAPGLPKWLHRRQLGTRG
ncbi:hypothetical protein GCM10023336_03290 [Streptomyces similanensis]|uniref:Phosphatidylglycerol lysyltransferase C-terminal domain-containing protein n=1 Tax=Streptomyces similanensis TaxID=1274988 RepID=A0ABP9JTM5_9ACTN